MIESIMRNWENAETEHEVYLKNIIKNYLRRVSKFNGPHPLPKITAFNFVSNFSKFIISNQRADIIQSIVAFTQYKASLGKQSKAFILELEKVFNYKSFVAKSKDPKKWNAYALCRKSKCRVCPYCHHAYAFTIQTVSNSFRPTLDHFYSKDDYPHLALTLYNLVPSCATCNSSLKGSKDFYKIPHLNPLFDTTNIKFHLVNHQNPAELIDAILEGRSSLKLEAKAITPCAKTRNSLRTFIIDERYNLLITEAIEFYRAMLYFEELELNPQINLSLEKRIALRFERTSSSKYLLGKMFADIYDCF